MLALTKQDGSNHPLKNRKIAVTGSGGFLGGHVCRDLIQRGYETIGVVRRGSPRQLPPDLSGDAETREADVLDQASLAEAFRGVDVVVNTVGVVPIADEHRDLADRVNLEGARNTIQACVDSNVPKLIHISSIHSFGPLRGIILNTDTPLATTSRFAYSVAKATAHQEVVQAMSDGILSGSVICPSGIIGPQDDRPSIVGRMLLDIANKEIPMLIREGYWWTDVRDVAQAIAEAVDHDANANSNVYLTIGKYATLSQLAQFCSEFLGRNLNLPTVPYAVALAGLPFIRLYAALRNVSPLYTRESLDLVRDCPVSVDQDLPMFELGYRPRPIRETVFDTLEWFKHNGMLSEA